jgi:transposase InsO family protein
VTVAAPPYPPPVEDGDLDAIRRELASRKWTALARLEDAVSELWAVHGLDEDELIARVRETIAAEKRDESVGR